MTNKESCADFRRSFEPGADSESFASHRAACGSCRSWHADMVQLSEAAAGLPQFDVPESVTQGILSAVERQPRPLVFGHHGLLLPIGLSCLAISGSLLPFDTLEGFAATLLSAISLSAIYLFIKSDSSEEQVLS